MTMRLATNKALCKIATRYTRWGWCPAGRRYLGSVAGRNAASDIHWRRRVYRWANKRVSPIAFSTTMDDWRVIEQALDPRPGQTIVCLASAGDTPLNLLSNDPAFIHAVDISDAQIHSTCLKVLAIKTLDFQEFLELVGIASSQKVMQHYQRLRPALPADTRTFWDEHIELLDRGLVWQGAIYRLAPFWAPIVRGRARLLRKGRLTLPDNPYLAPLQLRRLPELAKLPPYLTESGFAAARGRVDRVSLVHDDIRAVLQRCESRSVDGFALSNVTDWLPGAGVEYLFEQMERVAQPGARVWARVLLCGHRRSPSLHAPMHSGLERLPELEIELMKSDRVHDTLGHRGRKGDPLYGIRNLLRAGAENLTERQWARLDAAIGADEHHLQVWLAWSCSQQLRAAYQHPDPVEGRKIAVTVADSFPTCPVVTDCLGRPVTGAGPVEVGEDVSGSSYFRWGLVSPPPMRSMRRR